MASTEDDLQRSIYIFRIVASKYNMDISVKKSEGMAFRGKEPVLSKIERTNSSPTLVISHHFKES